MRLHHTDPDAALYDVYLTTRAKPLDHRVIAHMQEAMPQLEPVWQRMLDCPTRRRRIGICKVADEEAGLVEFWLGAQRECGIGTDCLTPGPDVLKYGDITGKLTGVVELVRKDAEQ